MKIKGHNRDTFLNAIERMRPPSTPKLDRSKPGKWFISWNHDVPHQLWDRYPRKRIRIKVYDNINRYSGIEREEYAELRLKIWQYNVTKNGYNPFEEELLYLNEIKEVSEKVTADIIEKNESLKKEINIIYALDAFIESRKFRTKNGNTISTWLGVTKWFSEWLISQKLDHLSVDKITRKHVANALMDNKSKIGKDGNHIWSNRTYNNNLSNISSIFNWFVREEMIPSNPFKGKIDKLRTTSSKNEWYRRETLEKLMPYLRKSSKELYYVIQFTYHLAVRSQQELIKLKVADLDFSLNRIRFRKDVSKNGKEEYREWPSRFSEILLEMRLENLPGDYYIFGTGGKPGPKPASKNTFANYYRPIKEIFELPSECTIYSFKHTRVVHEMMKGTDPYEIQYLCRHSSLEETQHYMRGFDLTLRHVYEQHDLTL